MDTMPPDVLVPSTSGASLAPMLGMTPISEHPLRVFMTAAEVSGDRHGAQFIHSLRKLYPNVIVEGVGGPAMESAGAIIHRNTVTNAAMGIRGALRAFEIYSLLRWTRKHFDSAKPDLWVGVDSPSMNFHFARAAKERGIPTLQFVAPQLWAWASWRMKKLRRWVDEVACVLPFEEAYFRAHNVNATFVGHPLFDELASIRLASTPSKSADAPPVIGLLPGSRKSVANANFSRQLKTAAEILRRFPGARFKVPTTVATDPIIRRHLQSGLVPRDAVEIACEKFDELVSQCDLCITVSGTATLHVASLGVPMIVVYAGGQVIWNLAGRWLIRMRTYAMVNLLADPTPLEPDPEGSRHVVPEFVPWNGPVTPVADYAIDLLTNRRKLNIQRDRLAEMVRQLDKPGASHNVARMASRLIARGNRA
jgi:lipid-A-disaccharide synthase